MPFPGNWRERNSEAVCSAAWVLSTFKTHTHNHTLYPPRFLAEVGLVCETTHIIGNISCTKLEEQWVSRSGFCFELVANFLQSEVGAESLGSRLGGGLLLHTDIDIQQLILFRIKWAAIFFYSVFSWCLCQINMYKLLGENNFFCTQLKPTDLWQ